jgi:hypothetical protein
LADLWRIGDIGKPYCCVDPGTDRGDDARRDDDRGAAPGGKQPLFERAARPGEIDGSINKKINEQRDEEEIETSSLGKHRSALVRNP